MTNSPLHLRRDKANSSTDENPLKFLKTSNYLTSLISKYCRTKEEERGEIMDDVMHGPSVRTVSAPKQRDAKMM